MSGIHNVMVATTWYESDARIRRQAEALVSRGDRVTVLALSSPGRPRHEVIEGVTVYRMATKKYRGDSSLSYAKLYSDFAMRAGWWLSRRLRKFDLVQAHSMPEALVMCGLLQKISGVPLLLDVHDMTSRLFANKFDGKRLLNSVVRGSESLSYRASTELLTVHEPYADILRSRSNKTVTSVLNSPDEKLFSPFSWRPWSVDSSVVFGFHGTIADRNGVLTLVEALNKVRAKLPHAKVRIRGGGDGLPGLKRKVEELNLPIGLDDVVDLPERPYPVTDMPAEIDKMHIGVVPNVQDPWNDDVLPTKLLEYAAMGIPAITYRNEVIEKYFPEDSVTYVDIATPETVSQAMFDLAMNMDRAQTQAIKAREALNSISWDVQKDIYFSVIDRMTARKKIS